MRPQSRRPIRRGAWTLSLLVALTLLTACGSTDPYVDDEAAALASEAWATRNLDLSPAPTPAPAGAGPQANEVDSASPVQPPSLSLTCPEPWASRDRSQRVEFGYKYEHFGKAKVFIDYGDGRSYSTSQAAHIASAFWHEYRSPGHFNVTATLRTRNAPAAKAACSFFFVRDFQPLEVANDETWLDAMPDDWAEDYLAQGSADLSLPGSVVTGLCADGSLTSAVGQQGACSWHGGLAGSSMSGGTGTGMTWVDSYVRSDGTRVSGYFRRR